MNTTLAKNALAAIEHIINNGRTDAHWRGGLRDISTIGEYYILRNEGEIVEIAESESIEDYLINWDATANDYCELCAEFGVPLSDNDKGSVDEDYEGEVKIWVDCHYYAGTCNAPTNGWVKDDYGTTLVFRAYKDAQECIDELEDGTYQLSHGEYSRPDYTICEA